MKTRRILQNKFYLYLTEFFSGMSVMAVELGASRLMAPYFSSSQIVWTIIIGAIMIAMALGNIYGGRSADRNPDPDRLYRRILFAGLWIAAIPVFGRYVILGISAVLIFSVNTNFLIWAAFAACMVIFVFPLFLLGTVTPSLVKYTVDSLDDSGKVVGTLNAANTIGSIIGTFLPTFVTIPSVGTSVSFLLFSGILVLLAAVYFLSAMVNLPRLLAGLVLFVLFCVFGHTNSFAFWENDLTYEGESVYNYLQVKENEDEVILSTNVLFGVQSMYVKDGSLTGMYYDYAMAAAYMAGVNESDHLDALILGMGTGTYATQCSNYFDNITFEGVEIDGKIIDLSYRYFSLPEDTVVTEYDGRAFLNATDRTWDIIMVDAYQDITIPFQMASIEFFTLVREHLTPDGVMIVNMNMRSDKEGNTNRYLADTISHVFSEVYTADVRGSTNRVLFASNTPAMLETLSRNMARETNPELLTMMQRVQLGLEKYSMGSYLLTDDKAPMELLSMRMIDELISEEVAYYKGVYQSGGIRALLELLT